MDRLQRPLVRKNEYIEGYGNPDALGWERDSAHRLLASLETGSDIDELGVLRWLSNGNIPPEDVREFAAHIGMPIDLERCAEARAIQVDESLAAYRLAQVNRTPEQIAEDHMEARAELGPGVALVNIVTGETYTT